MTKAKKSRSGSQRRKAVMLGASVSPELAARVDVAAESDGVTRSAWVRAAIEAKLGGG